jgi:mannitol 2-dehydrogenase
MVSGTARTSGAHGRDRQEAAVPLRASTLQALADRIAVPGYDRGRLAAGVVHIGVGGFHRAHQAAYHDRLLEDPGARAWGICGVGVLDGDRRMRTALDAQDGLYTLVEKHGDGTVDARVIGALCRYLFAPDDPDAVVEAMAAEGVRIVSLTITEGGYAIDPDTGRFDADDPAVARDLAPGSPPRGVFGLVVEALRRRRERNLEPFAIMSCDNLPGNGRLARSAFSAFAHLRDPRLGDWVERNVAFPSSMVDRITPATTDDDRTLVRTRFGVEDRWPVVCEPFAQWVLEDAFSGGRPPYERVGVRLVDDVAPYELMKLRLLNAGHQALAYFGRLCGLRFAHEAAQDPLLREFARGYMEEEAAPTLPAVPGVDVHEYIASLLERFANPHVGDTLERLSAYATDRIPKFLLPVVHDQLAAGGEIRRSAAIVASWARFAEGVDEDGRRIELVDRRADDLSRRARRQATDPDAFLRDRRLFGDLAEAPRFVAAYRSTLHSLHERGPRATLEALAAPQHVTTDHQR